MKKVETHHRSSRGIWINVIGSGRPEYDLPSYLDIGIRLDHFVWPKDGSVHRIDLPRSIFKKGYGIKLFGTKFFKFTKFNG